MLGPWIKWEEACSSPCTLILLILPTNCFPLDRFFPLEWSFLLLHVLWSREFPDSEWIQTGLQQPQEHTSLHIFLHIPAYGAQLQVTSLAWDDCFLHKMLFWFFCSIVLNKFLLEESTSCSGYCGVSLRSLTLSCYTSELSGQWRIFQTWPFCVTHARTNFLRVYPHYPDITWCEGLIFPSYL